MFQHSKTAKSTPLGGRGQKWSLLLLLAVFPFVVSCVSDLIVELEVVPPDSIAPVFGDADSPAVTLTGNDAAKAYVSDDMTERYIFLEDKEEFLRFTDSYSYDSHWDHCYLLWPYSENIHAVSEGVFSVTVPQDQAYCVGGPDPSANLHIGATETPESEDVEFHAAIGYLKLNVCGTSKIRSVTLKGNAGEVLAGEGILTAGYGKIPTLSMRDTLTSIRLDLGDGVVPLAQGVDLWFCLPSITFLKGLTISIETYSGLILYTVENPVSIIRGRVTDLKRLGSGTAFLNLAWQVADGTLCPSFDLLGPDITVCVPYGADLKSLRPVFEHNGDHVIIDGVEVASGKATLDGTVDHLFTVVSSVGKSSTYSVHTVDYNIPVIYVSTPQHRVVADKVNWITGSSFLIQNTDGSVIDYDAASIKGRGNTSWTRPKKSYGIKLATKPVELGVLGLPGHKRWCMIAIQWGYFGNNVGYELARRTVSYKWQPSGRYVEFVHNGKHLGTYFLAEQIRIDKNRVDIKSLHPEDISEDKISGGYLVTYDHTYNDVNKFKSQYFNMPVMIKDPDDDDLTPEQFAWIKDYINTMEKAIKDDDQFARREYAEMLDIDSYIDMWFVWETAGKTGSYEGADFAAPASVWFYKDRGVQGGKFTAGPCWDFDSYLFSSKKLYCTKGQYYGRLFQDPVFVARVKEKWPAFRAAVEGTDGQRTPITAFLESCYNAVKYSADRNQKMWTWTKFEVDSEYQTIRNGLPEKLQWLEEQVNNF